MVIAGLQGESCCAAVSGHKGSMRKQHDRNKERQPVTTAADKGDDTDTYLTNTCADT